MNRLKILVLLIFIGSTCNLIGQSPSSYPYPNSINWSVFHKAIQQNDDILSTGSGTWGYGSYSCDALAASGGGVSFMLYQNASSQRVIGFANADPGGYYNGMSVAILVVPVNSSYSSISLMLNGSVIANFGNMNLASSPLPVSFYIDSGGNALVFFAGGFVGQFSIGLYPSGLKIATAIQRNGVTINQLKSIATCTPPSVQGQVLNCNTDIDPSLNTTVVCATVPNVSQYSWKITKTGTSNSITILTTVPSITSQMIANQYYTSYSSSIYCSDVKIRVTPIFPSGYPMTGTQSPNCSFTILCNPDEGVYYELSPKLNAGLYSCSDNKLYIKWKEDYSALTNYSFKIYTEEFNVATTLNELNFSGLDKEIGDNRLILDLSSFSLEANVIYVLEMKDEKGKAYYLKFMI